MTKTPQQIADAFEVLMRGGYLRVITLCLLDREKSWGYKLQQDIEEMTKGRWIPSDGTIYNTLRWLKKQQLITVSEVEDGTPSGRRKTYKLTEKGITTLNIVADKLKNITKLTLSLVINLFDLNVDFSVERLFWD